MSLEEALELLDIDDFKIIGNKLILGTLKLNNESKFNALSSLNYKLFIDYLDTYNIPKCERINSLTLNTSEQTGKVVKVKNIIDRLSILGNKGNRNVMEGETNYKQSVELVDLKTKRVILNAVVVKGRASSDDISVRNSSLFRVNIEGINSSAICSIVNSDLIESKFSGFGSVIINLQDKNRIIKNNEFENIETLNLYSKNKVEFDIKDLHMSNVRTLDIETNFMTSLEGYTCDVENLLVDNPEFLNKDINYGIRFSKHPVIRCKHLVYMGYKMSVREFNDRYPDLCNYILFK